jgi:hypothetical protein
MCVFMYMHTFVYKYICLNVYTFNGELIFCL